MVIDKVLNNVCIIERLIDKMVKLYLECSSMFLKKYNIVIYLFLYL